MQRFFITHILSEKLINKYQLSQAGCNFSFNLISGGGFEKVYSILGTKIAGKIEDEAYQDSRYELLYLGKLRGMGHLFVFFAILLEQYKVFRKIPSTASVWFYNIISLNAFLYFLLKIFKPSVRLNVIVLDFTPINKGIGLNSFFIKMINKADGNICLSSSDLFTCPNSLVLPGVTPAVDNNVPTIQETNNKFLLSGVLNEQISQLNLVLRVFSELPDCELHITGRVENDAIIKEYSSKYSNIKYYNNLSFEDYLIVLHSITFQLSTRDYRYPENQCNFPSKILEALLHNRAVLSTISYSQIEGLNYFLIGSELETMKKDILAISNLKHDDLSKYINQGKIVREKYNPKVWNDYMNQIERRCN